MGKERPQDQEFRERIAETFMADVVILGAAGGPFIDCQPDQHRPGRARAMTVHGISATRATTR